MWPQEKISYERIFGNNVKDCREAEGLTRKELAEEILGVPEELICQIENGVSIQCPLDLYIDIANHFKVPLETLITNRYLIPPTKTKVHNN